MAGWTEVMRVEIGRRRLSILSGPDGLFRYDTSVWTDAPEDEGAFGDGLWLPEAQSGYYESAAAAEADARASLPWLRDDA